MQHLPVISKTGKRLMPCHAARARQLIRKGKAVKRFDRGICYLHLTEREDGDTQPVALGIDPGSQQEAFTIQGQKHTYINVQADAVTWVKDAVATRRQMRRVRRYRKTPYRACRPNRQVNAKRIPPSTRARWGLKLRIAQWLARYYPITSMVIEDIAAATKADKRRWNASFSPLEVGKEWAYGELERIAELVTAQGRHTKALRDQAGLKKTNQKLSDTWEAHCVDSFVLASYAVNGPSQPTTKTMLYLSPLRFHRRQLHRLQPEKGGVRKPYGGTRSLGLKRGSWVRHATWGVCYVGGARKGRISLHKTQNGKRLTQNAKAADCHVLCTASWRIRAKAGRSSHP